MRYERFTEQLESLRAKAAEHWPKLTKSDLASIDADPASLAAVLSRRYELSTKQAREQASTFVDALGTTLRDAASVVGDAARDLWRNGRSHVVDAVHNGSEKVGDLWAAGRDQMTQLGRRARRTMHDRPMTTLAVAAGVGAALALLLRRR